VRADSLNVLLMVMQRIPAGFQDFRALILLENSLVDQRSELKASRFLRSHSVRERGGPRDEPIASSLGYDDHPTRLVDLTFHWRTILIDLPSPPQIQIESWNSTPSSRSNPDQNPAWQAKELDISSSGRPANWLATLVL